MANIGKGLIVLEPNKGTMLPPDTNDEEFGSGPFNWFLSVIVAFPVAACLMMIAYVLMGNGWSGELMSYAIAYVMLFVIAAAIVAGGPIFRKVGILLIFFIPIGYYFAYTGQVLA